MLLNWIDYIFLAIVVGTGIFGFLRGFIKEIISVVTWILAVFGALHYGDMFTGYMHNLSDDPVVLTYLSRGATFLVIFIVGWITGFILTMMFNVTGLSIFNRILGLAFGGIKGFVFLLAITYLAELTGFSGTQSWQQAGLTKFTSAGLQAVISNGIDIGVSPETKQKVQDNVKTAKEGAGAAKNSQLWDQLDLKRFK